MTNIVYTAAKKRIIARAMGDIERLAEQNYRDEQRLRACRKAERKERSSSTVADANCIGWFHDGKSNPDMSIKKLASEHDSLIAMPTLLGALYGDKANDDWLWQAAHAHDEARKRWSEIIAKGGDHA